MKRMRAVYLYQKLKWKIYLAPYAGHTIAHRILRILTDYMEYRARLH